MCGIAQDVRNTASSFFLFQIGKSRNPHAVSLPNQCVSQISVEFMEHHLKGWKYCCTGIWPFSNRHNFTPHIITSCKSCCSLFSSPDHWMTALAETNSRWDDMYLWILGYSLALTYCHVSFSRLAFLLEAQHLFLT